MGIKENYEAVMGLLIAGRDALKRVDRVLASFGETVKHKKFKIKRITNGWMLTSKSFKVAVLWPLSSLTVVEPQKDYAFRKQSEVNEYAELLTEAMHLAYRPFKCDCGEPVAFAGAMCCENCGEPGGPERGRRQQENGDPMKFKVDCDLSIDLKVKCVVEPDGDDIHITSLQVMLDNEEETPVALESLEPFDYCDEKRLKEHVALAFDDHFCGHCGKRRYLFSTHQDEVQEIKEETEETEE